MTRTPPHLQSLRAVPAFRSCSYDHLTVLARLIETVDLPAGSVIGRNDHEVVLTLEPTRVLVVGRRAWPTIRDLVHES